MAPWTLPYLYSLFNNIISTILMNLWTIFFLLYSFSRVFCNVVYERIKRKHKFSRFWLYVFFCKFIWINIGLLLNKISRKNIFYKVYASVAIIGCIYKPLSIVSWTLKSSLYFQTLIVIKAIGLEMSNQKYWHM